MCHCITVAAIPLTNEWFDCCWCFFLLFFIFKQTATVERSEQLLPHSAYFDAQSIQQTKSLSIEFVKLLVIYGMLTLPVAYLFALCTIDNRIICNDYICLYLCMYVINQLFFSKLGLPVCKFYEPKKFS